jgi:hypothetical protein
MYRLYFVIYIYICPPLWSCGQEFLAIDPEARVRFPALTEKKAVGLERGPLSLLSTTEELLGRKSSGSCLEIREYCVKDPSRWPRGSLYPLKLALTSPTDDGRSVGIVRSRTQATEFSLVVLQSICRYPKWPLTLGFPFITILVCHIQPNLMILLVNVVERQDVVTQ